MPGVGGCTGVLAELIIWYPPLVSFPSSVVPSAWYIFALKSLLLSAVTFTFHEVVGVT